MVEVEIYYEKKGEGQKPFVIYLGECKPGDHPLHNQAYFVSNNLGGTIPTEVMDSFSKLKKFSQDHQVPFEELCLYAYSNETNKRVSADCLEKIKPHHQELKAIAVYGNLLIKTND